jgi:hypothetical protein
MLPVLVAVTAHLSNPLCSQSGNVIYISLYQSNDDDTRQIYLRERVYWKMTVFMMIWGHTTVCNSMSSSNIEKSGLFRAVGNQLKATLLG